MDLRTRLANVETTLLRQRHVAETARRQEYQLEGAHAVLEALIQEEEKAAAEAVEAAMAAKESEPVPTVPPAHEEGN